LCSLNMQKLNQNFISQICRASTNLAGALPQTPFHFFFLIKRNETPEGMPMAKEKSSQN
jgi:hypothetical protein